MTEAGLAHQWFAGCTYINPDNIARDEFGSWNDPVAVATDVDRPYLYDNSEDGATPRLFLRGASGRIVRSYGEIPQWAAAIVATLRLWASLASNSTRYRLPAGLSAAAGKKSSNARPIRSELEKWSYVSSVSA